MMIDEKQFELVEFNNESFNRMIGLFLSYSNIHSNPAALTKMIKLSQYNTEIILLRTKGFEYDTSPRFKELTKLMNAIQAELTCLSFSGKFDDINESRNQ